MKRRLAFVLGAAGLAIALAAAGIGFQDNIARFLLNPRTPFQTQSPPPPPEYGARGAWALWPDRPDPSARADIFYVHSTTYYSPKSWNAPIGDAGADAEFHRNAAPNEVGPFFALGPIYAPRYRQATLFAFFTHKFDGVASRKLAYGDIKSAFEHYLKVGDPERPLILVGYGQGGLHIQGLLKDFFQTDKNLRGRLVAAYAIDQSTPLDLFKEQLSQTGPCAAPADIRCIVTYTDYEARFSDEIDRARRRAMTWTGDGDLASTAGRALLCVNPLNWAANGERAAAERHLGAASATGIAFGSEPPAMSKIVGAQCIDGVLVVDRPEQVFLRRASWFSEKWRARSFNLFYYDLAADALRRTRVAAAKMEAEARILDPIGVSIDLEVSPIHKAPRN